MNAKNEHPSYTATGSKQSYESPKAVFAAQRSDRNPLTTGNYPSDNSPCGDCEPVSNYPSPNKPCGC